jgi:hypothetical protein
MTTLAQIRPEQAAAILIQAEFELPPDLAAKIQAIAKGGDTTRPDDMSTESAVAEGQDKATKSSPFSENPIVASPRQSPRTDGQTAGADASRSATPPSVEFPDLVTLTQAAAIVHRQKRTLERYVTKGILPAPSVEGGGGRAHLYDWKVIRPVLEKEFNMQLPEVFPANR